MGKQKREVFKEVNKAPPTAEKVGTSIQYTHLQRKHQMKNRLTPKNLRRMRLVLGYKQTELGKSLKIPFIYISKYENNNGTATIPDTAKNKMKVWISSQGLDLKTLPKLKGTL